MVEITENQLIGVYVKRLQLFEPDFSLSEPSVEGYLCDKANGTCIKGNSSDSNLFSYVCPFTLTQTTDIGKRSNFNEWIKLIVIDGNFSELSSENKLLLFEICRKDFRRKSQELDTKRVAWAFLVPLASDGSTNTNQELRLQLYKVVKNCKISHQDCSIFHLYTDHKLQKLAGSLHVSVKGVVLKGKKPSENKEEVVKPAIEEEKLRREVPAVLKPAPKAWEWSRLPNQSCRIPNKIHRVHNMSKNGVSCLKFSRNGIHVAAAVLSHIIINEVVSGEEVIVLNGHIGFIYELDWSPDDQLLLSVSNDCRGAVWSLFQKTPIFVLPHPSYVYCGRWFGSGDQIITGGRDHLIRFWCRKEGGFDLIEEISGHSGFVSALATQDDSLIFSGDSHGCVMIRKHCHGNFTLMKQLSFSESSQNVIDSIHLHSSRRRIIVSVRRRGSHLVDIVSGIILQTFKSAVSTFVRSVSCLTPCGSFLFSFCQNGDVGVWEVNTGRLLANYDNLFPVDRLSELSGSIQYHPHEHLVGITAVGQNYPLLLLKYDLSKKDDSEKLGLTYSDKRSEGDCSPRVK